MISDTFISVAAGSAWRSKKDGAIYGIMPRHICDDVRRRYADQYGTRPVFGPDGIGRKDFVAVIDAAIADDDAQAADYAAFMADQAFAGR